MAKKKEKKTNRVNEGVATNDLVFSTYQNSNDFVFKKISELYFSKNQRIAELTYGKGVFWKQINKDDYKISFSDLKTNGLPDFVTGGIDSRKLPYKRNFLYLA